MPYPVLPPESPALVQTQRYPEATQPDRLTSSRNDRPSAAILPEPTPAATHPPLPELPELTAATAPELPPSAALLGPPVEVALPQNGVAFPVEAVITAPIVRFAPPTEPPQEYKFSRLVLPNDLPSAPPQAEATSAEPSHNNPAKLYRLSPLPADSELAPHPLPTQPPLLTQEREPVAPPVDTNTLPTLPDQPQPTEPETPQEQPSEPTQQKPETPQEQPSEPTQPKLETPQEQPSEPTQPKPTPTPPGSQRQPPGSRTPQPQQTPQPRNRSLIPVGPPADLIEIKADRQEYDEQQQIVTAIGNVLVRFRQSAIDADRAIVNLATRQVLAEGNVAFRRGQQVVRGQRLEYNLAQAAGTVEKASGEIYLPQTSRDFNPTLPTDISAGTILEEPLSDRIARTQTLRGIRSPGALTVTIGGSSAGGQPNLQPQGEVNRLRFEAEKLELLPDGTRLATNIRITNDPFSPPEFEYRAAQARLRSISPFEEELVTTKPRLVFDQHVKIPVFPQRQVFDRRQRSGPCFGIGYDRKDRGGLYVQCPFELFTGGKVRLTVTPQFLIQRAYERHNLNPFYGDDYALKLRLTANLGPRTTLFGNANILSFNNFPDLAEDEFRGNLRLLQAIGNHSLAGEYSYRDRLFNGSLGYQTVQSSIGAVLTSPVFVLGQSNINLSYQASYNYINADTDRPDLLLPIRENNRIKLSRYQASIALSRGFVLWRGTPLPRTATQGLKYTRVPVVPSLQLALGVRGTTTYYSSGDSQDLISGSIGLQGQFGHFSRPFLDYTAFNITYTQALRSGLSPFLFDRAVDLRILSFGITQQVFGAFRIGFQTSFNVESGKTISTDYTLEYSRRTYGIVLRINPQRQIGTLTLRVSDFNWNGNPEPFSGDVRSVEGGVIFSD